MVIDALFNHPPGERYRALLILGPLLSESPSGKVDLDYDDISSTPSSMILDDAEDFRSNPEDDIIGKKCLGLN
jgi:hypothetical protein